jgi:hypothetical protein
VDGFVIYRSIKRRQQRQYVYGIIEKRVKYYYECTVFLLNTQPVGYLSEKQRRHYLLIIEIDRKIKPVRRYYIHFSAVFIHHVIKIFKGKNVSS